MRMKFHAAAPLAGLIAAGCVLAQEPHGASHHPQANRPLMALHERMEPFWHGTPGPELNARVCAVVDDIGARARAAAIRPTPDHGALVGSAKALKEACDTRSEAAITAEVDRLHQIFHRLAGAG